MKREFAKPFIMVDGRPEGTVKNIAMFDSYEDANHITRMVYGDTAFADEYKWLVQPGDKYRNGAFYTVDEDGNEESAEYIPTDTEQISQLTTNNQVLNRMAVMQAMSFTDAQALTVREIYPLWSSLADGTQLTKLEEAVKGTEITKVLGDDGLLYKVITTHKKQSDWAPVQATASLFTVIEETHDGTIDDPIPYSVNMIVYEGKYYIYNDILYRCTRDSGIALQYTPDALIGHYFETVDK